MGKNDMNHSLSFGAEHETPEAVMIQTAESHVLRDPRYPTAVAAAAATVATPVTLEETAVATVPPRNNASQLLLTDYVLNPLDKTVLVDHHGRPITVGRMLATKPLRDELLTRPGPGGRKLTYLTGESVTRTLNEIFGFDGWHLQILKTEQTVRVSEENARKVTQWHVAYMAQVRITHRQSGTYKEDLGAGDAVDRHLPTAVQFAMKASITDALKRAARHFGDKLGNSLYQGTFNMNTAPKSFQEALDQYDQERALAKFGEVRTNNTTVMTKPVASTAQANTMPHARGGVSSTRSMPPSAKHHPPPPPSNNGTRAAVVVPKLDHNVNNKQRHSLPERLGNVVTKQQQQQQRPSMVETAAAATTTTHGQQQQQRSPLMISSLVVNTMTSTKNPSPYLVATATTTAHQPHQKHHPRPPPPPIVHNHNNPPLTAAQGLQNSMFTTGSNNNNTKHCSSEWLPRPETSAGRRKAPSTATAVTTSVPTTTHGCDASTAAAPTKKPKVNNPYSSSA